LDYFLKIDGIEGESRDSKHKGEIELESWSWGETQAVLASGGGGGAGKVQMQDFHFVTRVSKASPKLFLACASGQHVKSAQLTARKAGERQLEFLRYTLSDVLVTSYQTGGSGAEEVVPMDQVSLNFSKIQVDYTEQKPDGSAGGTLSAGWDVKTNKKA
jgi:type VI secretion system secreted protein Hcp